MGVFGNVLNWLFGDDEERKQQYQDDIDDTLEIAFDSEESAMYDEFDELGQVPRSNYGDESEEEHDTPPWDDPPSKRGLLDWLLGR